jgi:hypothetical protein
MSFINRLLFVGLLGVGMVIATTAHAGTQLFDGLWTVKSFGNEITGGTGDFQEYSAWGAPQGWQCNPNQPRCAFDETPTDGYGSFAPLGGSIDQALFCEPWADWGGKGTTARPAKGATLTTPKNGRVIPPLYRNPVFFTKNGEAGTYSCTGTSTGATPGGKGLVQAGQPITGRWGATTTGTQLGGFSFGAAPASVPQGLTVGMRGTGIIGEFSAFYPYIYSYTYATIRNDAGVFGPDKGPGSFNIPFLQGASTVASINVKQGSAKFGGTMQMLGAMTTKVCYYRNGGCSLGENNWRYEAIGTSPYTNKGVITAGYLATYKAYYYHTALMQLSTVNVQGERFPWTTGSVTVTATGRGPHKTIHYSQGYDNRDTATASGKGVIQMVSPVLTRWTQPALNFETGGIGILRIKFVPEPQTWAMLAAGVSLLALGYRSRER